MTRSLFLCLALLALAPGLMAAERIFDFGKFPENQQPSGFHSTVAGLGKPGDWRVLQEEAPSALPPSSPKAPITSSHTVLAQLSQDPTDEHFPMLVYEGEVFDDFHLTTKFKIVKGEKEQMAGIAFRIQNETNYYVVRASALGNTFRFYKVVNGDRGNIIGPQVSIPAGTWHELALDCKGAEIRCQLDGKDVMPALTDTSFTRGKIGFWTKSDSVSYFGETKITYKLREVPAQALVRETVKKYSRVLGLKLYVRDADTKGTHVIASSDAADLNAPGNQVEDGVLANGAVYYGKENGMVIVTLPLRDRNGDAVAAARVLLKAFVGQTEQNAITRAMPVVKEMQTKVQSIEDLIE
jgi:hypothetical protein